MPPPASLVHELSNCTFGEYIIKQQAKNPESVAGALWDKTVSQDNQFMYKFIYELFIGS